MGKRKPRPRRSFTPQFKAEIVAQGVVGEVDVGPVQAEGFAAAQAGAEEDFEDVGVPVGVGLGVVVQEGCGLR